MPGKRKMQVQLLTAITGFSNPRKGVVKGGGGAKSLYLHFFNISSNRAGKQPAQGVPPEGGPLQKEGQV